MQIQIGPIVIHIRQ